MPSLDAQCLSTSALVTSCLLDDRHWQAFGYRRCPRRGKVFDIFISAEKLERETVLLREFWAASFGRVFHWSLNRHMFQFRIDFVGRLLDLCIDGIERPLWPALRFVTANDSLHFLRQACKDYAIAKLDNCPEIFLRRCTDHLSQVWPKEWLVGAAWLFADSSSTVTAILPALNLTGVGENTFSDIVIRNQKFRGIAEELFAR